MRLDELTHDLDLLHVGDAKQDERCVTRNAISPEAALSAPIIEQHARSGPAGRIGINQRACQPGIELCFCFRGIELAQGDLAVRPGQIEGPIGDAGMLIFFYQRERVFPAFRCPDDEIEDSGFIRR